MTTMIDTLAASRILVSAGFEQPQAEAIVTVLGTANDNLRQNLVTSDELKLATATLQTAMAKLETAIATSKTETIRWFFGSQVLLISALAVLQNVKFS